jgi:hypothetical protein
MVGQSVLLVIFFVLGVWLVLELWGILHAFFAENFFLYFVEFLTIFSKVHSAAFVSPIVHILKWGLGWI